MALFSKAQRVSTNVGDFGYLADDALYFDSACQTLRPQPVIDALTEYYHEYNACGGRVKYAWGQRVDEQVELTREKVLRLLGKNSREYVCAFTLNTTYGVNLILSQLKGGVVAKIITSEIEHNSVFLPTQAAARRLGIPRQVLPRFDDGSLSYTKPDLQGALVVVNATSNIDGRKLQNAKELCDDTHHNGGLVVLDGAQAMGHDFAHIKKADFDALCFSAHKMYGPSLGVIVIKRSLLARLDISFVGGGMVQDVEEGVHTLTEGDLSSRLEPGLQNFGAIIAFGKALDWLTKYRPNGQEQGIYKQVLATQLSDGLHSISRLHLVNGEPSTVVSFYTDKVDAHRMAQFLSAQGMMVRSGYFCCHYYLLHVKKSPPLVRISLGLHNTPEQVDKLVETIKVIMRNS